MVGFSSALSRHGKRVELWRRIDGADDGFGVASDSWSREDTVLTTRSYPNRNTTVDEPVGAHPRNKPVLLFGPDADVRSGDRIKYEGEFYELQSPSPYLTHIEIIANIVDDFSPT